jgi:hypothetical protein
VKTCSRCSNTYDYSIFVKAKHSKDGLTSHCKLCNREYLKAKNREYVSRNPEKVKQSKLRWEKDNLPKIRSRVKANYWKNKKKHQLRKADYMKTPQGRATYRAACSRRRARLKMGNGNLFKMYSKDTLKVYLESAALSVQTEGEFHVDHIVPLVGKAVKDGKYQQVICGLHVPWNLQILSGSDNCKKNSSFDWTWENKSWMSK